MISRPSRLRLSSPRLHSKVSSLMRKGSPFTHVEWKPDEPKKRKSVRRGPGKHWLSKPAVIVFPDGRERCNPGTVEGRAEYEWRRICMFVRQWNAELDVVLCCVCRLPITLAESTWEHEFGRHASRIDERLWNPDTNRPQNGVSHKWCNSRRGSRRTEIFHGNNCVIEKAGAL